MIKLGKLTHYSIDLVLISIILAGIHRNTGLQFDVSHFSSIDFRRWFGNYLSFGETCYDYVVSFLKMTGYFKQRNLILDKLQNEGAEFIKRQTGRDINDFKQNEN
ncbi:conserved hypothetical protein [Lodderomyces elongisporus NRRL YB-4239]|uniref:DUF1748-domain-containing protein n=2 Tax=Lodderomyces elongisporus TaxID=36914 RepID=A5DTY4_LODEL|nr:conserved hypothetical protein [Lodderomyces elongisporus NRRL YB-4239]